MSGELLDYNVHNNKVVLKFEKEEGIIEIIKPDIIKVFAEKNKSINYSYAVEDLKLDNCEFKVRKDKDNITVNTEQLIIKIYNDFKVDFYDNNNNLLCRDYRGKREPFPRRGRKDLMEAEGHKLTEAVTNMEVKVIKEMQGDEYFYGLGEKTGPLNKREYRYKMWNTDDPTPHVESFETLYKSIPFFISISNRQAYGIFFDNTFKSYFDFGKENKDYYYFGAEDGNLNYYFIYGPEVTDVVGGYTFLTGTTPLPQLWTLGYQQCRHSYDNKKWVKQIADNFRKKEIPCDALYLDIEYMDGYRVFTWDEDKFPDFTKTIDDFNKQGFKVVTIIDPGVKKDKGYSIYDQGLKNDFFATDTDGIPYVNEVWPGDTVFPDFSDNQVRKWWGENHQILLENGISGIWNDMNEPASFNGPLPDDVQFKNDGHPTDHSEIHNVYGHLMSKSTYMGLKKHNNKRPFVITRACYAGTQKYSTVWTGDNQSFWEHLRMSLPMLMNLGLSGFAFAGTDVGGFSFDCTAELMSRWIQVGCFTPLFRNHSNMYTREQEPWAFDEKTENICRKYINLRYKLLPYLYDLMWEGEKSGKPVMRPLLMHYQDDETTYEINDQFMFGEKIMVAPVIQQGQKARSLYLPEGEWFDYWTKEQIEGGRYIIREAPLDTCPIYIKAGSIIPNYPVQQFVGEKNIDELILDIYPGNGQYIHYQDDGKSFNYQAGEYNLYKFTTVLKDELLKIDFEMVYQKYNDKYNSFKFKIINFNVDKIIINNKNINYNKNNDIVSFAVPSNNSSFQVIIER
ncbi:MAG: glycoside hydrolase family 31 protein [Halothermotrichaceae bacterium]